MESDSFNNPDHAAQHKKMRERSRTTSNYRRVLNVYTIILENEDSDSDYWSAVGDAQIMNEITKFEHFDWTALEADLKNWSSDQLLIIADALRRGDYLTRSDLIIAERRYLYSYIFSIADNEIAIELWDDIEFVVPVDGQPLSLLSAMKEKIHSLFPPDEKENITDHFLKAKVEKFHELLSKELEKTDQK